MKRSMRILALNCGSSSIKSAVIDSARWERVLTARVEDIATPACALRVGSAEKRLGADTTYTAALQLLLDEVHAALGVGAERIVAHRIVHGGEQFTRPTLIDDAVLGHLERLSHLAPLHNPPALDAVRLSRRRYGDLPHVAVFDTAFHSTLPTRAREYALPSEVRRQFGIRRFGFHGLSHSHVLASVAGHLRRPPQELRIISCHLGNGASIAAIEYGRSVETSMGMTPLEGLVMGSRAGDIDPGVLLTVLQGGWSVQQLDDLLNQQAGLKGLTGTNDVREIEERAAGGDEQCRLALQLYAHRVRKYIGAYAAVMGGVDAIAFTGGVGENSALIRHRCLQRLDFLGAVLDEDRNRDVAVGEAAPCEEISEAGSRTRLFVVRADEELMLAREAARLCADRAARVRIPIAVSARHAHLSQATLDGLFGHGYELHPRTPLSQPQQFAAEETVSLIGPRGRLEHVRLMGPPRQEDQVEISRSDEFVLGVDAPVRISGDLANTPGIAVEGPAGRVTLTRGLICARRHIHMSSEEARRMGLADHATVDVRVDSDGRDLIFSDVTVRVAPDFRLELHLDTDEANAAGVSNGDFGELLLGEQ